MVIYNVVGSTHYFYFIIEKYQMQEYTDIFPNFLNLLYAHYAKRLIHEHFVVNGIYDHHGAAHIEALDLTVLTEGGNGGNLKGKGFGAYENALGAVVPKSLCPAYLAKALCKPLTKLVTVAVQLVDLIVCAVEGGNKSARNAEHHIFGECKKKLAALDIVVIIVFARVCSVLKISSFLRR